ncbi:hypothetical protein PESP_a0260 [Pseudoalteromonas espejiana DSM 9414]|nr:hypothetical protein PESP_a0260 [Pseudoalteromonas espejiana DSM 9414]
MLIIPNLLMLFTAQVRGLLKCQTFIPTKLTAIYQFILSPPRYTDN